MRRAAVVILVSVLCSAAPLWAQGQIRLHPTVGWDSLYRPAEWTPVEVNIVHNLTEPLQADLVLSAAQDDLTRLTVHTPVVLMPGRALDVRMVTKLAFGCRSIQLSLVDEAGRTIHSQTFTTDRFASSVGLETITRADTLIGWAGQGGVGLSDLPRRVRLRRESAWRPSDSSYLENATRVARKFERSLPVDWTGYASLDALVLLKPDWSQLHREQASAIARWVHSGGTLVLVDPGQIPPDNPIARLLPATLRAPRSTALPPEQLEDWGLAFDGPVALWGLDDFIHAGWQPILPAAEALGAWGPVGFGHVGVIGFDPSTLGRALADRSGLLWRDLLVPVLGEDRVLTARPEHYWYGDTYGDRSLDVMVDYFTAIPEMRPLSVWTIIALLLAMAVVLGPVNYIVLKRLDRLPWTWAVTGLSILLFTGLAHLGVHWMRAGDSRVRVVSVADYVGEQDGWQTTFAGVFGGTAGDYRFEGVQAGEWWSAAAPSRGYYYDGMTEQATRRMDARQVDGSNLPVRMPVGLWAMQVYQGEGPAPPAPVSVSIRRDGTRATVTLVNRSPHAIRGGFIVFDDKHQAILRGMGPNGSHTATLRLTRFHDPWPWHDLGLRHELPPWEDYSHFPSTEVSNAVHYAGGLAARTLSMERRVQQGAALVCLQMDVSDQPRQGVAFRVAGREVGYDHVRVVRLLVELESEEVQ